MTKLSKRIAFYGVIAAVVVFGAANWAKSFVNNGTTTINVQGDYVEAPEGGGPLGAIEFNSGKITSDNIEPGVLQRKTVVVTAAQVDGLHDDENGIELLPNVGSSYVNQVVSITGFNSFSSESWNRGGNESFEVKWWNGDGTASAGNGYENIGASFSAGFLTAGSVDTNASKTTELWYPYDNAAVANPTTLTSRVASSSAVILTGNVNPSNAETSGITSFVFEIFYRVLPKY